MVVMVAEVVDKEVNKVVEEVDNKLEHAATLRSKDTNN